MIQRNTASMRRLIPCAILTFMTVSCLPLLAQKRSVSMTSVVATTHKGKKTDLWNSVSGLQNRIARLKAQQKRKGNAEEREREEHQKRIVGKAQQRKRQRESAEDEALDALGARLYYLQQRAFPHNTVDWSAYNRARAYRERMPQATPQQLRKSRPNAPLQARQNASKGFALLGGPPPPVPVPETPLWEFLGPTNATSPSRWAFGPGEISGRVNAAAFDPNNPLVYYLGAASGGVWKTTNRGLNWTPLTDFLPGLAFSSIAIDPSNSNIVYIGSGDYDYGDGPGYGLLKSVDGGKNWTLIGLDTLGPQNIRKIWVDPKNTQRLLVVADAGVYQSLNGGQDWSFLVGTGGRGSNVLYNADHTALYASFDDVGVFQSLDDGLNWTQVLGGGSGRWDIATSLVTPKTLYAANVGIQKVFRSKDAGRTWRNITSSLPKGIWGQGWYDFYLTASKGTYLDHSGPKPVLKTKDVLYLGLFSIYQWDSASLFWTDAALNYTGDDLVHTDQHCLVVNPKNPNEMLSGNDGGIYRFTYNPDIPVTGTHFHGTSLNAHLGVTQFYAAAYHPTDPTYFIGGTQDNSTPRSHGDFTRWDNVGTGDGAYCAINPVNLANQYDSSQGLNIYRTDDAWVNTFYGIGPSYGSDNVAFIAPFVIDNADTNHLYAGTQYVYQYKADTNNWTKSGDKITDAYILTVAAAPVYQIIDANTTLQFLYAGSVIGNLFYSADQGKKFHNISLGLPPASVTHILVSPNKPSRIYVTMGGFGNAHVWRCDDVTSNRLEWVDISGTGGLNPLPNMHTSRIALAPHTDEQAMYVSTDLGVFYSEDGGDNWTDATTSLGLPNVQVADLNFVAGTGFLQAATFGRGMWRLAAGNDVTFQFYPLLQNYVGSKTREDVTLQFYPTGLYNPAQNKFAAPIATYTGKLSGAGWFIKQMSLSGHFDLYAKVNRFLRKKVGDVSPGTGPIVSSLNLIGDVNGDNVIDAKDVALVKARMGTYTSSNEDVDGDGIVTQHDLDLVMKNLGKQGD